MDQIEVREENELEFENSKMRNDQIVSKVDSEGK